MIAFLDQLLSYDITVLVLVIGIVIAAAYALYSVGGPCVLDAPEDYDVTDALYKERERFKRLGGMGDD